MSVDSTRLAPGELAQLLGSRLCHDLISPLGAIGNGVELLEMTPDFPDIAKTPEMQLISESVAAARHRIQTFRMAFGQVSGHQRISRGEVAKLLEGIAAQSRLKIQLEAEEDFARADIQMVVLALMCLETALPWGGSVLVLHGPAGWRLVAEAKRTKPDPSLWNWLGEADTPRKPIASEVQFPLLADAAHLAGKALRWEVDEAGAEIAF